MARVRRPEARPDEILDAALAVFSEVGFAAARVEDIAARAGVSKGVIYLYFESKQSMLKALVRRLADGMVGAAEKLVASGAAGGNAEQMLRALLTFMITQISNPTVSAAPRLVLSEAQRFPEIAMLYRDAVIARASQVIAGLLKRGVAEGVFRDIDPAVLLRAVAGPMLVHMFLGTIFADPDKPAPPPEVIAGGLADLIFNGIKTRSSP